MESTNELIINYAKELVNRIPNKEHCLVCLNELYHATQSKKYLRVIDYINSLDFNQLVRETNK